MKSAIYVSTAQLPRVINMLAQRDMKAFTVYDDRDGSGGWQITAVFTADDSVLSQVKGDLQPERKAAGARSPEVQQPQSQEPQ